jgi:hypothetical protein
MPFTMDDLDRVTVRMGMSDKTLRDLSDTQFTAWLRSLGAQGTINYSQPSPGRFDIAIEERIRILNELEASGFYIPGLMGSPEAAEAARSGPDPARLAELQGTLERAAAEIDRARGLAQQVGEIDPRINLRQSLDGTLALLDAARGAVERARRQNQD